MWTPSGRRRRAERGCNGYRVTTLLHRYYGASHSVVSEFRPSSGMVGRRSRAPAT